MTATRDPLSLEYDGLSQQVLDRCISELWARIPVDIESRASDPEDQGGLTSRERAFQRSMWHLLKDPAYPYGGYRSEQAGTRVNSTYSLRIDKAKPRYEHNYLGLFRRGYRMRRMWCIVTPYGSALAAVNRKPADRTWRDNPSLRSSGISPRY